MVLGILALKALPMLVWGDILYDASMHLTIAIFVLYILWFFIDQDRKWRVPFFVFSAVVLTIISLQRIESNAHNDIGLLLGLLVSTISIYLGNPKAFHKYLEF